MAALKVNHFARLGISIGADENDIKKAYRTLAKKWHPDKNKAESAKERFQEIAASYEFLSSKDRREMHERELNRRVSSQPTAPTNVRKPDQAASASPSKCKTKQTSEASWSKTFTENYRKTRQASESSWSKLFTETSQSQQRKQARNNSTAFFDTAYEKPFVGRFSFTREHKSEIPVSSFSDDVFHALFADFEATLENLATGISSTSKKKPRQRQVAPETGNVTGLDETYFFSPPDKFSASENKEEKLPCPWCRETFARGNLLQHEQICGKFGLSADEDEDDDGDEQYFRQSTPYNKTTWQHQHEELIQQIRHDKLHFRNRLSTYKDNNTFKKHK